MVVILEKKAEHQQHEYYLHELINAARLIDRFSKWSTPNINYSQFKKSSSII